jgi:hypothetical protein
MKVNDDYLWKQTSSQYFMFIKLLIISVLMLTLVFALLGIRILLKRRGQFPELHIGRNKEMRKRGITCAKNTDVGCTPGNSIPGCSACDYQPHL